MPKKLPILSEAQLEEYGAIGITLQQVATVNGMARTTLCERFKKNPGLKLAYERGKIRANRAVSGKIFSKACKGNMDAAKFWMEKGPGGWRANKELDDKFEDTDINKDGQKEAGVTINIISDGPAKVESNNAGFNS